MFSITITAGRTCQHTLSESHPPLAHRPSRPLISSLFLFASTLLLLFSTLLTAQLTLDAVFGYGWSIYVVLTLTLSFLSTFAALVSAVVTIVKKRVHPRTTPVGAIVMLVVATCVAAMVAGPGYYRNSFEGWVVVADLFAGLLMLVVAHVGRDGFEVKNTGERRYEGEGGEETSALIDNTEP